MDNENPGTEVQVQNPPVQSAKPARVRKQKEQKPLILPVPSQIDGAKNQTLIPTIKGRYARIAFYTSTQAGAKPFAIIHDTENEKAVKYPGAAIERFTCALIEAALSGASMSGDGATLYVADNYNAVIKASPKFGDYVLELVPSTKSKPGLKVYRAKVSEWVGLVQGKAKILRASQKIGGTKARTTREVVAKTAPEKKATVVL